MLWYLMVLYGLVSFIFLGCLFIRKWKISGMFFVVILILTPFIGKSMEKEYIQKYEQALTAINNKNYDKAQELLNDIDDKYEKTYKLAQEQLKKINDIKMEKNVDIAETKFKDGNYYGAMEELSKVLLINEEHKKAMELLNKINQKIQDNVEKEAGKTEVWGVNKIDDGEQSVKVINSYQPTVKGR
ncbi:hypothetical protein [Clostridium lundense]|uniref:hypothetical protein n=1 Tax=Clostridium lundense TaxID=319475 RepID=UPI000486E80C|nr:hypothetical protein [Clostridium lundense]